MKKKMGYLNDNFKIFYIKDKSNTKFEYHHHDFNKIVILISGDVSYMIDGSTYHLKPWDILFVDNSQIHKPIINPNVIYERIVIWIDSHFIQNNNIQCDLFNCFKMSVSNHCNLLRANTTDVQMIKKLLFQIQECTDVEFGCYDLKHSLFVQLLIYLNRAFLNYPQKQYAKDAHNDKTIDSILDYINNNLTSDLSIDALSEKFFVSKYYLMRKFKSYTGDSIHSYIIKKRLVYAKSLMRDKYTMNDISLMCKFKDYSGFVRAFKKVYGKSPTQYLSSTSEFSTPYENE